MNTLLILDGEAATYEAELRKKNLPDLKIADIFAANYARYSAGSPLDYRVDFNRGH
jgi:hypothetical protein